MFGLPSERRLCEIIIRGPRRTFTVAMVTSRRRRRRRRRPLASFSVNWISSLPPVKFTPATQRSRKICLQYGAKSRRGILNARTERRN